MTVTNLKARPKALPDRISEDITNAKAILDGAVVTNKLRHAANPEGLSECVDASVPLQFWLDNKTALAAQNELIAVQIAADQSPDQLQDDLANIDVIVLPFVAGVDGRSYSHAYTLRTQMNFSGEIRAVGDVKYDQLGFLKRVGVNAFELAQGQDVNAALKAFNEFSDVYQPSADNGQLIFARRRLQH